MFNKKNNLISIFIAFLFCCALFFVPTFTQEVKTYAETTTTTVSKINSQNCFTDYEIDASLYRVLNKLAQHITNGDKGTIRDFDIDVFNYASHDASYYNPSSDYGNEILADLQSGVLNLSTGNNAKYGCLKNSNNYNIKYISGLDNLTLTNIHTIILDGNSITNVTGSDLSLGNLTTLSIANNKLKTFVLSPDLTNLTNLDLSSNQLKKVDISRLGENAKVNIACNNIENISDITFSNLTYSGLDVSFNNLTKLTQNDIDSLNSHLSQDNTANILIQGASDISKLYAGDEIVIYESGDVPNFNIKFFYNEESSFYKAVESNLIYSSPLESINKVYMPAGKIKIGFYTGEHLITQDNCRTLNKNVLNKILQENENGKYSVPIRGVDYKGYVNGKEVDSLSQQTDIRVILSVKNIDKIPNRNDIESSQSGAKYYYFLNTASPTNNNAIDVKSNGRYTYFAYVNFDGIESGRTRISIVRQDLTGVTWGIIVIVIIFVLFGAGYFVVKWFREGAQVAPLSEKEIYRMNKRRGVQEETNGEDDYISTLDAPRHDTRVSDQGYSDDSLQEDLNSFNEEIKPTNDLDDRN